MTKNETPLIEESNLTASTKHRDVASPALMLGGLVAAYAAQRVGELPIRIFSTFTALSATGFGFSAFTVGRKINKQIAESHLHPSQSESVSLGSDVKADELTMIIDLAHQPAESGVKTAVPQLIDLAASEEKVNA